jgi:hypothetical protein
MWLEDKIVKFQQKNGIKLVKSRTEHIWSVPSINKGRMISHLNLCSDFILPEKVSYYPTLKYARINLSCKVNQLVPYKVGPISTLQGRTNLHLIRSE